MAKKGKSTMASPVMSDNHHQSVSVRKIENGYVASHSSSGPKGEYQSTEYFHPKKPSISVSGVSPAKGGGGPSVRKPRTVAGRKQATAKNAAQRLAGVKV